MLASRPPSRQHLSTDSRIYCSSPLNNSNSHLPHRLSHASSMTLVAEAKPKKRHSYNNNRVNSSSLLEDDVPLALLAYKKGYTSISPNKQPTAAATFQQQHIALGRKSPSMPHMRKSPSPANARVPSSPASRVKHTSSSTTAPKRKKKRHNHIQSNSSTTIVSSSTEEETASGIPHTKKKSKTVFSKKWLSSLCDKLLK